MCSIITARLNAALVAVGTVVGLVVVSDGAQNPPIQYQLCAMICCSRSIGSRVTMATPSTTCTIASVGATSRAAQPGEIALDQRALAHHDRPAHHDVGHGGMRLHIGFGGGDEAQSQEVVGHALAEHLVHAGGALEQLLEVRIAEQLARADRIQIAVVRTVDLRHRVQPQLGHRIQQVAHGQRVLRLQGRGVAPPGRPHDHAAGGGLHGIARPANSGPGRTFLMGMPYVLGDMDPKDPIKGWDKTWAYLKALDDGIEYYPTGTTATMKELGEGSRDMIATTLGWDINPRVLGIVPKEAKVATLKGFHWVLDAQYAAVPKGLDAERMAVLMDIISFVLTPEQQALTYDEGFFYPGPVVKNVPISMAPASSQEAIKEYGLPELESLITQVPTELPLDADKMVMAFRRWDEEIGAKKTK